MNAKVSEILRLLVLFVFCFVLCSSQAHACTAVFRDLTATIERFKSISGDKDAVILETDFVEDPDDECRAVWVIEFLTEDGAVQLRVLDAVTLAPLDELPEYFLAKLRRPSFEEDSQDLRPVRIKAIGGPDRDLVEGEWSDDIHTGGPGRDTFMLTPGRDIVTDFNPDEDVLDMTNFIFGEFGFNVLDSLGEVQLAARVAQFNGSTGTEIDIDGPIGDWSVFLKDVPLEALSEMNVIFPSDVEPLHPPKMVAERSVELSDGSVVVLPKHSVFERPVDPYLEKGAPEALELVRQLFFLDEFEPG